MRTIKMLGFNEVYSILNFLIKVKYKWHFNSARKLTKKLGHKAGGSVDNIQFSSKVQDLLNELSVSIARDYIPKIKTSGFEPITRYGGDCGNVHVNVFEFIEKFYPELHPTLTIGSVYYKGKPRYTFNKKLITPPQKLEVFDAHAWITLGDDIVMDCTISTHLNLNVYEIDAFGPILVGEIGSEFTHKGLAGIPSYILKDYSGLVYKPVLSGIDAMNAISPKAGVVKR